MVIQRCKLGACDPHQPGVSFGRVQSAAPPQLSHADAMCTSSRRPAGITIAGFRVVGGDGPGCLQGLLACRRACCAPLARGWRTAQPAGGGGQRSRAGRRKRGGATSVPWPWRGCRNWAGSQGGRPSPMTSAPRATAHSRLAQPATQPACTTGDSAGPHNRRLSRVSGPGRPQGRARRRRRRGRMGDGQGTTLRGTALRGTAVLLWRTGCGCGAGVASRG